MLERNNNSAMLRAMWKNPERLEKTLRPFFERHIFKRGEEYFFSRRVGELSVLGRDEQECIQVGAVVEGSQEYEASLQFSLTNGTFTDFECTCPYDYNCKHSAALGLAFIEKFVNNELDLNSKDVVQVKEKSTKEDLLKKFFSALSGTATPEDIGNLIEELQSFKRGETKKTFLNKSRFYRTSSPNYDLISEQEEKAEIFSFLNNYYVTFSEWSGKLSLRHRNNPYQYASVNFLLTQRHKLTDEQVELLMILKQSQNARFDSSPVDLGKAMRLIKNLGISLRDENAYGYRGDYSFSVDCDPKKIPARLRFDNNDNEYITKPKFFLELPRTYVNSERNSYVVGSNDLVRISGKQVDVHRMSTALSKIIVRFGRPDAYSFESRARGSAFYEVPLSDKETIEINQIICDAQKYLDLTTDLTADYDVKIHDISKKLLLVDFDAKKETISIMPVVDYGFHLEDVSESIFVSRAGGRISFKRRNNQFDPDTHVIKFDGKTINAAPINVEAEESLFRDLYDQDVMPNMIPRLKIGGMVKLSVFYEKFWSRLEKRCGEIGCEIIFLKDRFVIQNGDFRANFSVDLDASNDLLGFDADCYLGPDKISLLDLFRFIESENEFFRHPDGRIFKITNREELLRFAAMLRSFKKTEDGRFEGKLYHAPEIEYMATSSKYYKGKRSEGFEKFCRQIKSGKPVKPVRLSNQSLNILRSYQIAGIEWLYFLRSYNFAGILADDMDLGKTLQALVLLEKERVAGKPSIVICPKSLVYNWQSEAGKFTPKLRVVTVDGLSEERSKLIQKAKKYDLLVTGYASYKKDSEIYKKEKIAFNYCVLDEAQFIKNHASQNAQIAKEVDSRYRLALTGTPLENSVSEIWSIFDFLMPGFLGSHKLFLQRFHKPIMERGDRGALELLRKKIECFMLRRTKSEVLKELPPKIEQESFCRLEKAQSILYQSILLRVKSEIFQTVKEKGFNKSSIHILAGLTKLRQICNYPNLLIKEKDYTKYESAKLDMFNELIEEMSENKRKVLVFSQFTEMLDILGKELDSRKLSYLYLSGKTRNRQELVDKFNSDPETTVFLISLRAGGTGLNLTAADNVIIFDPWWNPSVENQATDRAHRIGQKKSVNVYRFITKGTIEEKIVALQKKKRYLFDSIVDESKDLFKKLTWDDVQDLLQLS
ncbi:MAG: hypothetical protein A3H57_02725 [Candidatus Taylorbacteria bacterium RIFCSPLOWO2_02_FULL_43_11]|uniref:Helicase SNF2 n=1 Tax=Candidatus Taylorbacteria bacterium RIFCSPHIGHO2_02_FULL_43_32b TaxID=1802306 RepID=A0A1G2MGP1_9BACT|nr:MAG: hypothetical protein A2743_01120 [Candidatus Taylorbacteria bacterium RIFCSPHIGHO2_01_FULL_43_47]OHA22339.1 MAG: hypothetical protein A3C72_04645 [Candidatus Taylorbacteria bacterium RIFCSPHIGHO2_02_FULL_43_32b]OHA29075.1 MAG: hypothetical protein A3B08_02890 [Candidatus Taylorbacteria bacterium RIFCSPLOWO2_01_FULL_43_44]OHA36346.1 MAG: hypothetical protein A3H57_02725 [Candidatus Taylorbacteria bacterium RIFCSPLOWO2_02_FULL_43_11]